MGTTAFWRPCSPTPHTKHHAPRIFAIIENKIPCMTNSVGFVLASLMPWPCECERSPKYFDLFIHLILFHVALVSCKWTTCILKAFEAKKKMHFKPHKISENLNQWFYWTTALLSFHSRTKNIFLLGGIVRVPDGSAFCRKSLHLSSVAPMHRINPIQISGNAVNNQQSAFDQL